MVPSQHLFLVLPTSSELCPRAGILESRRDNQRPRKPVCHFAEGPTGPRGNLRQESGRSSWDIIETTGAGPSGLIIASAPGVRAWANPFCPFPAQTGGSRWDFCRDYFFPVEAYRRSIWVSVQASILLVLLQVGMTGDLSLLLVQDIFHELTLQPHQRATA